MATKDFLEKGINCIEYKDGKRVNVASYAEMALRTASHRATLLGEGKKRSEWGIYTVVVSAHANSCNLCIPWQGKVLIDDVFSNLTKEKAKALSIETGYPLLSTAMKEGLLHPNCRHTLATYFPGITQLPQVPDEAEARKNYEAEQRQRYLERQIRKHKRLEAGTLDPEKRAEYAAKVKELQADIRKHLEENPELRRNSRREQITNGLSVKERNDALKNFTENAKIEEIRKHIKSDKQPKSLDIGQQNKHIPGTNEYKQYEKKFTQKGQHGPSRISLKVEELQELVNKHAGAGEIRLNYKGEWDNREIIFDNDKIIGKAVNNKTGVEAETAIFKIHYSKKGVHIVPDYPSKKKVGDKN